MEIHVLYFLILISVVVKAGKAERLEGGLEDFFNSRDRDWE
jgi:hypothetical protein